MRWLLVVVLGMAGSVRAEEPTPREVLDGVRQFFARTAETDGSFRPGVEADYPGMSDCAYSDLAAVTYAVVLHRTFGWSLPHEIKTRDFLLGRQEKSGAFVNVRGTVDPKSAAGQAYNTTMGLMALRGMRTRPRHDPRPVFAEVLKEDYKKLPLYMTSFFPLAYLAYGEPIPKEADQKIRAMMVQDDDGYINDHVAATFHAAHYYRLVGEPTPKAEAMLRRILRDQKPDGSWMLNPLARDRHATFDAVFCLKQLGGGRDDCRTAMQKAVKWVLRCRNADGGFGHYPTSTSDADAVFFHVGVLVMAGWLPHAAPPDGHLLGWGHLFPTPK